MSGDPRIEILAVCPFEPARHVLAAVALRVGDVVIREARIVHGPCDAGPWLAIPQIIMRGAGWQPIAQLPARLRREAEALALAAWESGR